MIVAVIFLRNAKIGITFEARNVLMSAKVGATLLTNFDKKSKNVI